MTDAKTPKLPLPAYDRCGYHNENGEQCEKPVGHRYEGADPQRVGTHCLVGGSSFDGPEAAKRMRSRLIFMRKELAKVDYQKASQTVSVQAARRTEIERRQDAEAERAKDRTIQELRVSVHELRKLGDEKLRKIDALAKERDEAVKRAEAKHADWLKLRAEESQARGTIREHEAKIQSLTYQAEGRESQLTLERGLHLEEREKLLMRQGSMLDQLDRILLREGLRARDPALRCDAQQLDRCVLLDSHEGLHDDGCGTRWGDLHDVGEPAKGAPVPVKAEAKGAIVCTCAHYATRHGNIGCEDCSCKLRWDQIKRTPKTNEPAEQVEACGAEDPERPARRCVLAKGHAFFHVASLNAIPPLWVCGMGWWEADESIDKPAPHRCTLPKEHKGPHAEPMHPLAHPRTTSELCGVDRCGLRADHEGGHHASGLSPNDEYQRKLSADCFCRGAGCSGCCGPG